MPWNMVEWPLPITPPADGVELPTARQGRSPLERAALTRVERCVAAMSVRRLVRIALFPETIADFARWAELKTAAQVHNVLTGTKAPGTAIRRQIARRLRLEPGDMALIGRLRAAVPPGVSPPEARDGTSALERLAVSRARENLAAMTPGAVLSLAVWPFTETDVARAIGVAPQDLYNMLTGVPRLRYPAVRTRLCAFLGCPADWLDHLVDAPRAEAVPLPPG
jgi:hypothetical protein